MIKIFVRAVPVAALTLLTFASGMVAVSDGAEACRRLPGPGFRFDCSTMSTPRPDKPNQQKK
ncbi:MAG: hypothetical protein H6876_09920 [Hyphomicrobiaceae bacterium]|nr:hypothetical protein [Hyphomicrobiaceae bacterium]MCC0008422.1 hypothetical protein [Hyphomicrobiaceae bacterium]